MQENCKTAGVAAKDSMQGDTRDHMREDRNEIETAVRESAENVKGKCYLRVAVCER